ncbi:MAG: tyrosine decarboxylase MfnA [Methanosarcinaceae archaeon]|nr:tyrosine decarboxylase MfnA [Methanosarcinaceae archaeon]MDD4330876.1 tyrosine decarboxylase MfnA [Methanosarcinaceae archaeon]MDD4748337.1 tyrosine decarboxylase MfnA [Methanosarcinaceae archaeon]
MNEQGFSEKDIFSLLKRAKSKDTDYHKVLSSMCTSPHKIALEAHKMFLEANLGDLGLFSGTHSLEKEVITMLGNLLHAPLACGYMTTGGTESNIQAVRAMKNLGTTKKPFIKNPNIVVPDSAHFSFDKVANMLGVEVRRAALTSKFQVDISSMEKLIDKETVGLVGIAGNTEFGQVDPIENISKLALERELFLHVDAAFGGFVLPFIDPTLKKAAFPFDFAVKGVTSIAIDPHKMGLSTIPSGALLFRFPNFLDCLRVDTPYLTTKTQSTLTGTRSGAAAAATYAVMKHLGREGYRKNVAYCMALTFKLVKGVRELRELNVELLLEPIINVVTLRLREPARVRQILLEKFGWHISITRKPQALRLVLMPHTTPEDIDIFLKDLKTVLEEL